ncbi:hypothetical protein GCM10009799_33740 [Nocardiopsis rhodophaea]|uniref:Aminoglycoside phosphotransferase domain-containing protein n=1 Tax=Nocardiopsis rhodophaea TaxID=280238 RepID=A0ABN2TB41_9ACTN
MQTPTVNEKVQPEARIRHLRPADLERRPEVGALLERLGLGKFEPDGLMAYRGRNDNWAGRTTNGDRVFVKCVGGGGRESSLESLQRFRRILACERLVGNDFAVGVARPRCLGWDESSRLVAFEWLEDAETGAEMAAADSFRDAAIAGRMIGQLHEAKVGNGEWIDNSPHPLPPTRNFQALSLSAFMRACAAELEAWRLLQGDEQLIEALETLRTSEQRAEHRPVHGDLRLDQFLMDDGDLYLIDWEEFRQADPARDLGGFAGEWLYRAILGSVPGEEGAERLATGQFPTAHDEIMANGVREFERLRPNITAFWNGYRQARERVAAEDPELAQRATAFAGWHLIDRLLAAAVERPRLSGLERAMAGIGRSALVSPNEFTGVLGFRDESEEAANAG